MYFARAQSIHYDTEYEQLYTYLNETYNQVVSNNFKKLIFSLNVVYPFRCWMCQWPAQNIYQWNVQSQSFQLFNAYFNAHMNGLEWIYIFRIEFYVLVKGTWKSLSSNGEQHHVCNKTFFTCRHSENMFSMIHISQWFSCVY